MAVAGYKAGQYIRGFSECQVSSEAMHRLLVSAQEDPSVSEGDYGLRYPLPTPRAQRPSNNLRSVDLPNGYMISQSAREAAGHQPLDYSGNVDSNYANSIDDRQSVTGYVNFLANGPVT